MTIVNTLEVIWLLLKVQADMDSWSRSKSVTCYQVKIESKKSSQFKDNVIRATKLLQFATKNRPHVDIKEIEEFRDIVYILESIILDICVNMRWNRILLGAANFAACITSL